uniref:Uncharacterized protein n=1 Tax=Timema cristinae TaxID=61476 RepID=A0A7R9DBP1_TIMCR|nr:unnamed protein product [Timema cristinae]
MLRARIMAMIVFVACYDINRRATRGVLVNCPRSVLGGTTGDIGWLWTRCDTFQHSVLPPSSNLTTSPREIMSGKLEYSTLDGDLGQVLEKSFTPDFRNAYVSVKDIVMPKYFTKFGDKIQNLEIFNDDVWVASFPKTD